MKRDRVLFLLKFQDRFEGGESSYGFSYTNYFSSGLYWSAKFASDMLQQSGVESRVAQVVDNNGIDAEVVKFSPTVVIIEALWVVPEKFGILKKLHPSIKWIVRLHSNFPFLANEGVALDWVKEYVRRGVAVAVNALKSRDDIRETLRAAGLHDGVLYLPDYYPVADKTARRWGHQLSIASYGAIRPLKNQLIQAVAAIKFADLLCTRLKFHINSTVTEMGGNSVLTNLRSLFAGTRHTLVEDPWMSHEDFLERLRNIDIGMQVSFSETFSIVSADMASVGIPIVVSPEVSWAAHMSKVDPTDSDSIVSGLVSAYRFGAVNVEINRFKLKRFSQKSRKIWSDFLARHPHTYPWGR